MPVNISIKNVPDEIAARLRRRAAESHRSLQGEMLTILEEAVNVQPALGALEALAKVQGSGLESPDEATQMIRADRDAR